MEENNLKLTKKQEKLINEQALRIHNHRRSIRLFIKDMWGLEPQPVKPEYKQKMEELERANFETWEKLKKTVTADWYGVSVDGGEGVPKIWRWDSFIKGKHFTWQQNLILIGVEKSAKHNAIPQLSIVSGHGTGKSTTCAWIILWFLNCYYDAQVPVTAPTSAQMHDVLWKEISIWLEKMPSDYRDQYEWTRDYIRIVHAPDSWFARARTSSKENTEAIAGVHSDNVAIICDEASGIPEQVFETALGAMTSGNVLMILISNGTRPVGFFFDTHHRNKDLWQTFRFNCEESPVVKDNYTKKMARQYGCFPAGTKVRVKNGTKNIEDICIGDKVDTPYGLRKVENITKKPFKGNLVKMDYRGYSLIATDKHEIYTNRGLQTIDSVEYCDRVSTWKEKHLLPIRGLFTGFKTAIIATQKMGNTTEIFIKKDTGKYQKVWLSTTRILILSITQLVTLLHSHPANMVNCTNRLELIILNYMKGIGIIIKTIKGKYQKAENKHGEIEKKNIFLSANYVIRRVKVTIKLVNYFVQKFVFKRIGKKVVKTWNGVSVLLVRIRLKLINTKRQKHAQDTVLTILPQKTSVDVYNLSVEKDHVYYANDILVGNSNSEEYRIRVKGLFPQDQAMDDSGYLQLLPRNKIIIRVENDNSVPFSGRNILGVDPSGEGKDKATFVIRDQFKSKVVHEINSTNPRNVAEVILTLMNEYDIRDDDVVVDSFGIGSDVGKEVALASGGRYNIYTVLVGNTPKVEENYNSHFFERNDDEIVNAEDDTRKWSDLYVNIRALMYFRSRRWLIDGGELCDVSEENSDFADEIATNRWKRTLQGNKIQMMPKKDMAKMGIRSPNYADAFALTMLRDLKSRNDKIERPKEKNVLSLEAIGDDRFSAV